MTPAELSIKRPIFISCLIILIVALGWISMKSLPIDLFPDVTMPTVVINTTYSGSGPEEIETEVSKIIEDELSSIAGINKISSTNREGLSTVIAEFTLKTDIKYAEQQVRAKVDNVRRLLPADIDDPVIRTVSPSDAPIMFVALQAELPDGQLFDLADDVIRPQFEQVDQVGQVLILGGRKREIHVYLDRGRLLNTELGASQVANALAQGGRNIPAGKTDKGGREFSFRTMADYPHIQDIRNAVLRSTVGGVATPLGSVALVQDSLQDETSRTYLNAKKSVVFQIFRQSGANSVKVADDVKARVEKINARLHGKPGAPKMEVVNDRSRLIRANVDDVYESIFIGILLTVVVVYFFLGSLRSTLITGLALPNSLLGAFILMSAFHFSINIMSLLALSLVVGLLIDDAIVVRENIYRKIEDGMGAREAAISGTNEVTLAVVATTFTVLAVFGPIGNLQGIVGQYFKQFGLTVCFAMIVSLFDALTAAPMLSAYFAGPTHKTSPRNFLLRANAWLLKGFDRFQTWLENVFEAVLKVALKRPWAVLVGALLIFIGSLGLAKRVPVTFLPAQDNGEFTVSFDLPPGASLDATDRVAQAVDGVIRGNKQVRYSLMTVGNAEGEANQGSIYVRMVESRERRENTTQFKDLLRGQLKGFAAYNVKVADVDASGSNQRQFNLNITGADLDKVYRVSEEVLAKVRGYAGLKEPDTSFRPGKPEVRVKLDAEKAKAYGVSVISMGQELRTQVEGLKSAIYREGGRDYDVRVRMLPAQRDLRDNINNVYVPNLNGRPVKLLDVAAVSETAGPASILRENRGRYIQISADVTPGGPGLGGAMRDVSQMMNEVKLPEGVGFSFVGQAERFAELGHNIVVSLGLGVLFIYLVLASLYESFITPFTIMLVIPLAACGAFAALWLMNTSFDLFSMIGCVMLMGLATKNSILIVDFVNHLMAQGKPRLEAVIEAGKTRLRPILMTTFAMIAGMLPVAIGLNEASKQRTSLGIVVVGGTISSTLLTLLVIPAAFLYIDRFQVWFYRMFNRWVRPESQAQGAEG